MKQDDMLVVHTWRTSTDVAVNFPSGRNISLDEHQVWMEQVLKSSYQLYWIICDSSETQVGVIWLENISPVHRHAEFGFYLGVTDQRNTGIAAEAEFLLLTFAFDTLQMKKVYCESMVKNKRVLSQHKRFGFCEDGRLRSHIFKEGIFYDIVVMSILDTEFAENRSSLKQIFESLGAR